MKSYCEEACRGLDHADLAVGKRDQPLVDKLIPDWITRLPFHDVRFGLFVGQTYGRNLDIGGAGLKKSKKIIGDIWVWNEK